jgi:neutral trehalase
VANELRQRAAQYRATLATLWNSDAGIFLNKDLHTGEFSYRLSPTNFYPLLAKAATQQQADRMIKEHLLNAKEFWGKWVIPSIALNDPAFKDQNYWRGRIWGPMNYLVYLGLRKYDDPEVRSQFAQKSYELFLQEWKEKGHVHENYNGKRQSNRTQFLLVSGLSGWSQLVERLGGAVSQSWQDGCEVAANRQTKPAAAFYYGEDRSNLRSSRRTAHVDPVLATDRDGPHGVLGQIVVEHHQLQLILRMRVAGSQ